MPVFNDCVTIPEKTEFSFKNLCCFKIFKKDLSLNYLLLMSVDLKEKNIRFLKFSLIIKLFEF